MRARHAYSTFRLAATVLLSATVMLSAGGAHGRATVTVECAALSQEQASAVKARQLADLMATRTEGSVVFHCSEAELVVTVAWPNQQTTRRTMSRQAEWQGLEIVEQLLALADTALAEDAARPHERFEPPGSSHPAPPGSEAHPPQEPEPPFGAAAKLPDRSQVPTETERLPGTTEERQPRSQLAHDPEQTLERTEEAGSVSKAAAPGFLVLGTALYRPLGGQLAGQLGLGIEAATSWQDWAIAASAGYSWAHADAQGLRVREAQAALTAKWRLVPWLSVGAGPVLSWIRADADQATPSTRRSTQGGLITYLELAIPLSRAWSWTASAGAQWFFAERQLLVDQEVVAVISPVRGQFTTGIGYRF